MHPRQSDFEQEYAKCKPNFLAEFAADFKQDSAQSFAITNGLSKACTGEKPYCPAATFVFGIATLICTVAFSASRNDASFSELKTPIFPAIMLLTWGCC